jgi:hypothetical protein
MAIGDKTARRVGTTPGLWIRWGGLLAGCAGSGDPGTNGKWALWADRAGWWSQSRRCAAVRLAPVDGSGEQNGVDFAAVLAEGRATDE